MQKFLIYKFFKRFFCRKGRFLYIYAYLFSVFIVFYRNQMQQKMLLLHLI
jgi:hypothetical protein